MMHAAGAHDVGVMVAQLLRRRFGQVDDGAPCWRHRRRWNTEEALTGDGGDIDDAAAAVRDHLTRHPCRQENTPFEFTRWMQSQSASSLHAHFAIASGAVSSPTGLRRKRRPRAGGKTRPG